MNRNRETCLIFLLGILTASLAAQPVVKKFRFGGSSVIGSTTVTATDLYSAERSFGFEPGADVTCSDTRQPACSSTKPFYFSTALPEGNYRVSVTFGNLNAETSQVAKAELRRLMLERIDTKSGEFLTKRFIVNIRTPRIATAPSVPPAVAGMSVPPAVAGGAFEVKLKDREKTTEQWAWDKKLTLEFNGTRPSISSIEIVRVDVPTVFILGDSTVADQPGEPYASWGQMVTRFFNDKVAIANHAESGESLKSSLGAKRLDKVLSLMKPGDFLLIQYGHNDMKERGEGIGAFTSYKASLKQFVTAARSKGASVILINPMHRRTFNANGKITNSHGDYPEAVRQAAKEEKVPLIDLTAMSKDLYETLGPENSGRLFKEGDGTHHNAYGAYQIAKIIVQSIRDQHLPLAKFLIKGLPKYDPKRPDPFESFSIPASSAVAHAKPPGS